MLPRLALKGQLLKQEGGQRDGAEGGGEYGTVESDLEKKGQQRVRMEKHRVSQGSK